MTPPRTNEATASDPACSMASPGRTKMPAPIIVPTPMVSAASGPRSFARSSSLMGFTSGQSPPRRTVGRCTYHEPPPPPVSASVPGSGRTTTGRSDSVTSSRATSPVSRRTNRLPPRGVTTMLVTSWSSAAAKMVSATSVPYRIRSRCRRTRLAGRRRPSRLLPRAVPRRPCPPLRRPSRRRVSRRCRRQGGFCRTRRRGRVLVTGDREEDALEDVSHGPPRTGPGWAGGTTVGEVPVGDARRLFERRRRASTYGSAGLARP